LLGDAAGTTFTVAKKTLSVMGTGKPNVAYWGEFKMKVELFS